MSSPDLPELIENAAKAGFDYSFEVSAKAIHCKALRRDFSVQQIDVVDVQYVTPGSDAGDEATLFLLKADDGTKGYFIIPNPASLSLEERRVLEAIQNKQPSRA